LRKPREAAALVQKTRRRRPLELLTRRSVLWRRPAVVSRRVEVFGVPCRIQTRVSLLKVRAGPIVAICTDEHKLAYPLPFQADNHRCLEHRLGCFSSRPEYISLPQRYRKIVFNTGSSK
jgi:hypothetical protein